MIMSGSEGSEESGSDFVTAFAKPGQKDISLTCRQSDLCKQL